LPERIYVQIPSYRDRELAPTLRSLLETASDPARLRVAVVWQYGEDETYLEPELLQWPNVELIKVPAHFSNGCNWARNLLQRNWAGEEYTLFLDSHHRFVAGWDEQMVALLEDLRRAGVAKPILTGYLPPYQHHNDPKGRSACILEIHELERCDGLLFRLVGHSVPRWQDLACPMPARFVSLHCLFAAGIFNFEVEFDPHIYFFADEVAIALRAYTHGYDLFYPHRILGWHLYDRATRVPHWSDHPDWRHRNASSLERLRALYQGLLQNRYGIGAARTIADYEAYIGAPLLGRDFIRALSSEAVSDRSRKGASAPACAPSGLRRRFLGAC
jgi:hypothetical protein